MQSSSSVVLSVWRHVGEITTCDPSALSAPPPVLLLSIPSPLAICTLWACPPAAMQLPWYAPIPGPCCALCADATGHTLSHAHHAVCCVQVPETAVVCRSNCSAEAGQQSSRLYIYRSTVAPTAHDNMGEQATFTAGVGWFLQMGASRAHNRET